MSELFDWDRLKMGSERKILQICENLFVAYMCVTHRYIFDYVFKRTALETSGGCTSAVLLNLIYFIISLLTNWHDNKLVLNFCICDKLICLVQSKTLSYISLESWEKLKSSKKLFIWFFISKVGFWDELNDFVDEYAVVGLKIVVSNRLSIKVFQHLKLQEQ